MTEFAIAPTTGTIELRTDLAAMLAANELRAYRVRSNGTMRHVTLYPLGSTSRDMAEWVSERTFEGATVAQVAREQHVSPAAIRRILVGLELTEEIEAGEWDGIWAETGEIVVLQDESSPEARAESAGTVEIELDVPGSNCEPKGTTGDELEGALAASVMASEVRIAEVTENLRKVGAPEPERTARVALNPPPRKARSHG